jgi:hypothetical protein
VADEASLGLDPGVVGAREAPGALQPSAGGGRKTHAAASGDRPSAPSELGALRSRYRTATAPRTTARPNRLGGAATVDTKEQTVAIAYIQEFTIVDGDTSTTNYDAVVAKLDLQGTAPEGLLIHTAGFDHDAGVFRIFDVWQTRDDGERFIKDRLDPIIESMVAAATASGEDFAPPAREGWYDLHDSMTG